ncbi:MAG: hypothetical protein MUF42_10870 [Cytophagaceae bacterium]|jgi:hypothetical protein|nr:hypothetical protein [Cytophagaceae bacterium]
MNKKISIALLVIFIGVGALFFFQLGKLSSSVKNELYKNEIPIIVISLLAVGVGLAVPSLLNAASKETSVGPLSASSEQIVEQKETVQLQTRTYTAEGFSAGLYQLKKKDLEDKFWFFCDYFKCSLACLYEVKEGGNLDVLASFGFTPDPELASLQVDQSLGALALKSGKPEFCHPVPEQYFKIRSGLGQAVPSQLFFIPLSNDRSYLAELASFSQYDQQDILLMQESLGIVLVA